MKAEDIPLPKLTPEDLATERLAAAVESAIGVIEARLANLAANGEDAKWSISDLVKLLQLRKQIQGERPCTIRAYWVDDPKNLRNNDDNDHNNNEDDNNDEDRNEDDTSPSLANTSNRRVETCIDAWKRPSQTDAEPYPQTGDIRSGPSPNNKNTGARK